MRRPSVLLASSLGLALFASCVSDDARMGTFVSSQPEESDASTSDSDPSGDGDGDTNTNPSGDGDGDGDTGTNPTGDGDGDGDGELCQRYRYTYNFNPDTWDSLPLDQVWTGPNAPPCAVAPLAITFVEIWDQLLVWGDDGMFYRRDDGAWQPPEPSVDKWPVIADLPVQDAHNVPPNGEDLTASIQFVANHTAFTYELYEDGSAVFLQSQMLVDWPDPGPPAASLDTSWMLTRTNHELEGMSDWWQAWVYVGNDVLYHVVGIFAWENWPLGQSEMFDDAPVMVDPNTFEAAWGSENLRRAYFVGP